jgi:hypothetical protein
LALGVCNTYEREPCKIADVPALIEAAVSMRAGRARRFDAPQPHAGSSTKPAKMPIALLPPPTQATTSLGSGRSVRALRARFDADDLLELAHHVRIGMRADDAADDVERVLDARRPNRGTLRWSRP